MPQPSNTQKRNQYNQNVPDFLNYNSTATVPPVDTTKPAPVQNQVTPLGTAPYETGKQYTAFDPNKNKRQPGLNKNQNKQTTPLPVPNTGTQPIKIPGKTQPAPTINLGDSTKPIVSNLPAPTGDPFKDGTSLVQSQGTTRQDQILRDYNNATADIKLQEDQMKSKFTNSDEVLNNYKLVKEAYRAGVMDDDQISQKTGLPLEFVKSVKNDTRHKSLKMSGQGEEEQDMTYQYQTELQKMQKSKDRVLQDFDTAKEQMKVKYDWQVEDIKNDLAKRVASSKKSGALTGQVNSSGYLFGIEDMKNRTYKNIERMATQFGREDDEINLKRTRMLEDFESNSKEMFYTYNKGMDQLRAKGIAGIQSIQEKYGVASEYTSKALESLYNDLENQHLNVLNNTMKLQSSFNDMREQEIDATMRYEQQKLQLQQNQQSLKNQERQAVQDMLKDPTIPPATKLSIQAQMFDQTFATPVLENLKQAGEQGGQCAYYTNRVAGLDQSQRMGNEMASKTSKINSKDPVVGSVAVFDIGTRTGHVGIVKSIDYANGTMVINESNYKNNEKVGERIVPIKDKSVKGFVVPNKIVNPYKQAMEQAMMDQQIQQYNQTQMGLPEDQRNLADDQGNMQYIVAPTAPLPLAQRPKVTAELAQKYIAEGLKVQTQVKENPNFTKKDNSAMMTYKPNRMDEKDYTPIAGKYTDDVLKTASTIMKGSSLKLTGLKQGEKRELVASALEDMAEVAYQKNDLEGIMRASARFENRISAETSKQLAKGSTVLNQLSNIQDVLKLASKSDGTLQPLYGRIRQSNPWDTDAQTMKALLQSTVANLARGVYGEVGVLTDADVDRYIQTIPNMRQTKDVQKAVQAMTLRSVMNQMTDTINLEAGNGSDVSLLIPHYQKVKQQVETMEKELGIGASQGTGSKILDKYQF